MATRGTGYLLMKDKVMFSTEFNGDMYPEGLGNEFFKGLSKCNSEKDFNVFINDFNMEYFGYPEDPTNVMLNFKFYDFIGENLVIDFNNNYFRHFFSDWTFFKNLSGKEIKFFTRKSEESDIESVVLENQGTIRFDYGEYFPEFKMNI